MEALKIELKRKKEELEKHAYDHAADMTITLDKIENAEQEMKSIRNKISDKEKEVEELAVEIEYLHTCEKETACNLQKLKEDKEAMENNSDKRASKLQNEISNIESQIRRMPINIDKDNDKHSESEHESVNNDLLNFLINSVQEKEKELECPVCLDVAQVPIYMCQDFHLICNTCLPKLKKCPQCGKKMPTPAKRHRYAEKHLDEKKQLEIKIDSIVNRANGPEKEIKIAGKGIQELKENPKSVTKKKHLTPLMDIDIDNINQNIFTTTVTSAF